MKTFSVASEFAGDATVESDFIADKLIQSGKKVIKLNRGDPAVYFPTMKYIIDAYIKALKERKTQYSNVLGVPELREAVAERYRKMYNVKAVSDDVIVTEGASEGLTFLNSVMINPKDKAVLFRPYYSLYYPDLKIHGGEPILEHYVEKENWNIDTDSLERSLKRDLQANKNIKYLLVTNPNNPTGTVLDEKVLKEIVELAKNHNLLLISDEIYDEIIYNGAKFTSMAKLARGIPHVILNGASKDYDATGFRVGFMIIPNKDKLSDELKKRVTRFARLRICANTPAQYAVAEGIRRMAEHERGLKSMVAEIESRANLATRLVNESEYMQTVEPRGAYYIFPRVNMEMLKIKNDKEFVDKLLIEEHIEITRGSGFGEAGHVRIVTLATKDILELAINKINAFCKRHSK